MKYVSREDIQYRIALIKDRNVALNNAKARVRNTHLFGSYTARIRDNIEQIEFLENILTQFYGKRRSKSVRNDSLVAKIDFKG